MIFSRQSGSGDVIVLIHGFCETYEIWENIIPSLEKEYTVVALDLPGFGKSLLSKDAVTIDEVGDMVYNHIKELGIEKCFMVGHSLGGYIALSIAERHPDILKGVSLFHSTAYADSEEKKVNRDKSMGFIDKHGVVPFVGSFVPTLFADQSNEIITPLVNRAAKTPKQTVLKYTEAMKNRPDRSFILNNNAFPIQLIAGAKDNAVPLADSLKQSKILKESEYFTLLESAGHMSMYELPSASLKALQMFANNAVFN